MFRILVLAILLALFACQNKISKSDQSRMKASIDYLASDELKGRGTGTEGERMAANYIEEQFKSAGLTAYKENIQIPFEYTGEVELGETNSLKINNIEMGLFKDFEVLSYSKSGKVENASAEFLGYGIKAEGYNSYRRANGKKVVYVLDGFPESVNSHSDVAMKSNRREKARVAREAGAELIIFLVDKIASELQKRHVNTDAGIMVLTQSLESFKSQFKINENVFNRVKANKQIYSLRLNVSAEITINRLTKEPINLIAKQEGKNKDSFIIIGAHYDHLGMGYQNGTFGNVGEIHNGADDNASGTAGLMELAHMFSSYSTNHTILYMAFSGEELGLLGSRAIVNEKLIDPTKVKAMINLDMIGRLSSEEKAVTVYGTKTSSEFDTLLTQAAAPTDLDLKRVEHAPGNSDHAAFYEAEIPVLFFNTALHSDYHRPSDDADKINVAGQEQVVNLVADMIKRIDSEEQSITYAKVSAPAQRRMAPFKVYIGTHPDYAYKGKGLKITGTSDNSPAAKAGMQKGDILIGMAGSKIENIYDYMGVLGKLEPNKEIEIKVKRDSKEVVLKMTPAPRK